MKLLRRWPPEVTGPYFGSSPGASAVGRRSMTAPSGAKRNSGSRSVKRRRAGEMLTFRWVLTSPPERSQRRPAVRESPTPSGSARARAAGGRGVVSHADHPGRTGDTGRRHLRAPIVGAGYRARSRGGGWYPTAGVYLRNQYFHQQLSDRPERLQPIVVVVTQLKLGTAGAGTAGCLNTVVGFIKRRY